MRIFNFSSKIDLELVFVLLNVIEFLSFHASTQK